MEIFVELVMKKHVILFLLLLVTTVSFSQKNVSHNNLVWVGDFTKARLNDKWSIYFDFGYRRTEWLNKCSQALVRPGITYHFNKTVSATAGVAYFSHYTATYIRPEGRGWQQLLFCETYGRVKVNHRLRAEQRFFQKVISSQLVDDYNYNNRFRYQLNAQVPINKKQIEDKTVYFSIADEVFINSGKEIRNNYFDQNRLAFGLGYKLNEGLNILVSYTSIFVQRPKVDAFEDNNVLVINIYHNLDFGRKTQNNVN